MIIDKDVHQLQDNIKNKTGECIITVTAFELMKDMKRRCIEARIDEINNRQI